MWTATAPASSPAHARRHKREARADTDCPAAVEATTYQPSTPPTPYSCRSTCGSSPRSAPAVDLHICAGCGACSAPCPSGALGDNPARSELLFQEEALDCSECGTLFGAKSAIEKIFAKLASQHAMFASEAAARLIRICDDCRVAAQYHSAGKSFAPGERPKPRTTAD